MKGYPKGYSKSGAGRPLLVSTGLYAAAGDVIRVNVAQTFLDSIEGEENIKVNILVM